MIHIDDLPFSKLIGIISNLKDYSITEKVDGSQLLFGIDEYGFYTSRETKGGTRIYNANEYPITFSTTYIRSAHLALESVLPQLISLGLSNGDQIEIEVLYTELPNVISYSKTTNYIIFLRTTLGKINIDKLNYPFNDYTVNDVKVPTSINGKDVSIITKSDKWCFRNSNPIILPVSAYDKIQIVITQFSNSIELKQYLIENLVNAISSSFGATKIEGLVLRNILTNSQYKIVDKDTFLKEKNFIWQVRNSISETPRSIKSIDSFQGRLYERLLTVLNLDLVLLTTQSKSYLRKFGSKETILNKLSLNNPINFKDELISILDDSINFLDETLDAYLEQYLTVEYNGIKYQGIIHSRTLEVFADTYLKIRNLKNKCLNAETNNDIIIALFEKQLIGLFGK